MRRLKICYVCKTWAPDAQDVHGTTLCMPCWADVVCQMRSAAQRRERGGLDISWKAGHPTVRQGGAREPAVATLGEGPDDSPPQQLEMFS